MENFSFITIIISSFNSEKLILETLRSVKNQTYPKWECIVSDDGSTDNTQNIIKSFCAEDNRFSYVLSDKNSGKQPVVLNKGIARAIYNYILILDSDDILDEKCLEHRLAVLDSEKDMNIFPNFAVFKDKPGDLGYNVNPYNHKKPKYLKDFIVHRLPTPFQVTSIIWKKEALNTIGNFNERMKRMVDVELHSRAFISGLSFSVHPSLKPDYYYRITESETQAKSKRRRFFEASQVFIDSIRNFTEEYAANKNTIVNSYLKGLYFNVLSTGLLSRDFTVEDVKNYLVFGKYHKFINLIPSDNQIKIFKYIAEKPLVRNLIFRLAWSYINTIK